MAVDDYKVKNLFAKKNQHLKLNRFLQIDQILSGYLHGQFNVCLILGVIYAVSLTILGLEFGFSLAF